MSGFARIEFLNESGMMESNGPFQKVAPAAARVFSNFGEFAQRAAQKMEKVVEQKE